MNHKFENNRIIKYGNKKINVSKIITVIIIGITFYAIYNIDIILNILENSGLQRFNKYIINDISLAKFSILKILPIILLFIYVSKNYFQTQKDSWFFVLVFMLNYFVIAQLATTNDYASRIGYLFQFFNMIFFVKLCNSISNKSDKKIIKFLLCVYLFGYWYYTFIFKGFNQTYPFKFYWG